MLPLEVIHQPMRERMAPLRNKRHEGSLLIHEIYCSIQGESSHLGKPCVFVRTSGCHLRCSYCDTEHAFFVGAEMGMDDIVSKVLSFGIEMVELTGGEPLLQPGSLVLLERLASLSLTVLLETSGAVSIARVDRRVKVILDVKTPSSGENKRNRFKNLDLLWPGCEVKFVISDREDFLYAKEICQRFSLFERTHVLFSPMVSRLAPPELAEWILADRLPARLQLQLHRILYGEAKGR